MHFINPALYIPGQHISILEDGLIAGRVLVDLEDTAPLGKITPVRLVTAYKLRNEMLRSSILMLLSQVLLR